MANKQGGSELGVGWRSSEEKKKEIKSKENLQSQSGLSSHFR